MARGFHARDGLHFLRLGDGSVQVSIEKPGRDEVTIVILDAHTWASAVASVSSRGEDGDRFETALRFHSE